MKTEEELLELADKIGKILFVADLNPLDVTVILGVLQHNNLYALDKRRDAHAKEGYKVKIE